MGMAGRLALLWAIIKHPFVVNSVLLSAAYWGSTKFLWPDQTIQISNYVLVAISITVISVYLPATLYAERRAYEARREGHLLEAHRWRRAAILSTGISLVAVAGALIRSWSIVYRWTDWSWMQHSHWIGYFVLIVVWGWVHHIIPPDAIEIGMPGRSWIRTGVALGVGLLLAALAIGLGYDPAIQG